MKIGDLVKSTNLEIGGRIQDVGPCTGEDCDKMSLTLDPEEKDVRFYYHVEDFVLIPSQRESAE